MSTYTTNIPQSNQTIKSTTSLIRANFDNLAAGLSNDHADINDPTSGTRLTHDKVRLNVQAVGPSTITTQVALYAKNVTAGGTPYLEWFFRRANNGSEIQLSSGGLTPALSGSGVGTQGYTFLPGGLVYVWGHVAAFVNNVDQTFPQVGGINVANIYQLTLQVAPPITVPLGNNAAFIFVENINNALALGTFKPRYLKVNGDDAFACPTYYQAIVELAP